MTQLEVAKLVGISRSLLSRYEMGDVEAVEPSRLSRFARAFDMTPEVLNREIYGQPVGDLAESPTEMVRLRRRGSIPAGEPSVEEEVLKEEYDQFPRALLKGTSNKVYTLKILGDSLSGDGINKGDIVAVDPAAELMDGKIYAVRLENEVVARHVTRCDDFLRLSSSNGDYKDIEANQVEVLGRIIASWKYRRH